MKAITPGGTSASGHLGHCGSAGSTVAFRDRRPGILPAPSIEAATAIRLIGTLERELAATRRLAIAAFGVALAALGAVATCVAHVG